MSAQDSRVLVVDEPPVDAERISTDGLGDFAVSIVPSRADARERLDGEPKAVDCVVIGAFDADALGDFLRAVAANNPTVPVVVVATDAISAATVIEAGAAAVITEADADVLAVLEHRIGTVIAANCARREPPARAVLEPFSHGKLVALFDGDRRHVAAAGDRLADRVDLLHVVGDCRDGLPCADGALEPTELETHTVRTFFLDGPGGRETAHDLLSSGSVAGAVLDDSRDGRRVDALRRRFLRGFVGGFSVDVATRWARARLATVGHRCQ
ncbi:hypothetical protein [Halovivax gelatinilyticus]|uniref:hypothetical protein n=1 Tax=Halovivax gelatinilyticus TaxID=2961597 RepID=UPI0020CA85D4|nr:hypothetical protein [Halovivax gelatinilyticus]